MDCKGKSFIV